MNIPIHEVPIKRYVDNHPLTPKTVEFESEDEERDPPDWIHGDLLWQEDDATPGTEGHKTLKDGWLLCFGVTMPDFKTAVKKFDGGDAMYYLFDDGRIAVSSYPGGSEIRTLKKA